MQANKTKRVVKVSHQGETKRLKVTESYQELMAGVRKAFGSQLPSEIKFFYLDEENEVISINSQADMTEEFDSEVFGPLKLIIAVSAVDAREQLLKNLEDSRPLAESLNASQILG